MNKKNSTIGAAEWLADITRVVKQNAKAWRDTVAEQKRITAEVRAVVTEKVLLLKKKQLQPLDRDTYRAAVLDLVNELVGDNADPRAKKSARQTITAGNRWGFGVFSPSEKRRAQVAGSKPRNKATKQAKAEQAKNGLKVPAPVYAALVAAATRGVSWEAVVIAINAVPATPKKA
jgi:hypothetical protein